MRTSHFSLLTLTVLLAACGSTPKPTTAPPTTRTVSTNNFTTSAITASAFTTGYSPEYSADGKLSSWWSASGTGQWIRYDLDASRTLQGIQLAFQRGDLRKATFDVEVSQDGSSWTRVLSGAQSSGTTQELESYAFTPISARFVRVTNGGNSENSTIDLSEARFIATDTISAEGATASAALKNRTPQHSLDRNFSTYWGAKGKGAWIRYDLGSSKTIDGLRLAFERGNVRTASFDVDTSNDGSSWTRVLSGAQSSGTTLDEQLFAFKATTARFVRVTNLGNSEDHHAAYTEARFSGPLVNTVTVLAPTQPAPAPEPTPEPEPTQPLLATASVSASGFNAGYPPEQAVDKNLGTWWSANGLGQFITHDLGASASVNAVHIAFYKGDLRKATFDVLASGDGVSWTKVLSATSSGTTLQAQRFAFTATSARFVRIVSQGNTENTAAAFTETAVEGALLATSDPAPAPAPISPYSKAYYLDCLSGNDANSGTSETNAWKSLSKANTAPLQPGEALLLKRGCTWDGQLTAKWNGTTTSPVTIGAYGSGELPRVRTTGTQTTAITISGSHQVLEYLEPIVGNRPGPYVNAVNCTTQSTGWRVGFAFQGSNNTVQHSRGSHFTAAIHFSSGTANKALYNTLINNDIVSTNTPPAEKYDDDSGAWGVLLNAHGNEVAYNTFGGNIGCSEDYGTEGASVEIYKGSDNYIHHNVSINDGTFTELGGTSTQRAERNTFAYNLFAPLDALSQDAGEFLVVRGWTSSWGANPGTKAYNNTAYNVQVGVACFSGCGSDILDFRNNIVIGAQNPRKSEYWTDSHNGTSATESNNVFGRIGGSPSFSTPAGRSSTTLLLNSSATAALFVSPASRDFQLSATSAAANRGVLWPLTNLGVTRDLAGNNAVVNSSPDAGAYERQY